MRIRERVVDAGRIGVLEQATLYLAEPHARAFVESPICDNAIRDTCRNSDGGLLDVAQAAPPP